MKINVKGDFKGNVTGRNLTDSSEIEIEKGQKEKEIDLSIGKSFEGDITGIDKTTNSKKKSKIVWVIAAIGTILLGLAAYYFNQN